VAAQRRLVIEGAVLGASVGVEDQTRLGSPPPAALSVESARAGAGCESGI